MAIFKGTQNIMGRRRRGEELEGKLAEFITVENHPPFPSLRSESGSTDMAAAVVEMVRGGREEEGGSDSLSAAILIMSLVAAGEIGDRVFGAHTPLTKFMAFIERHPHRFSL